MAGTEMARAGHALRCERIIPPPFRRRGAALTSVHSLPAVLKGSDPWREQCT